MNVGVVNMPDFNQWGDRIPDPDDFKGWAIEGWHAHFKTIEGEWGPYGLDDFERRRMHGAPAWLVAGVRERESAGVDGE
jgi:hypothetical protein